MILIIYFIAILFIGVWIWNRKNKFALNEESLHKQRLFWLAILFPLFSSLYFMLTLGFGYPPNINIDGFNNFLNMHKFSLGILTLSPILGAFVVSAHRSIQTAKQIEVTEKKNKVDIYFLIKKNIIEQLNALNDNKLFEKYNPYLIYNNLNKEEKEYNFKKNSKVISDIDKNIIKTITYYRLVLAKFNEIEDIEDIENEDIRDLLTINDSTYLREYIENFKKVLIPLGIQISKDFLFEDEIIDFNKVLVKYPDHYYNRNEINSYIKICLELLPNKEEIRLVLEKIFLIIFPDKKIAELLPNFYLLDDPYIGDKVATENQNNHE
ncbi:hypothetical protein ABN241_06665 [Proteus terrae]|uniref:hypothetical protein n=1 Tax=Proteus terrae TaxID=1574161 RepID=UPI0032DA9E67